MAKAMLRFQADGALVQLAVKATDSSTRAKIQEAVLTRAS